MAVWPENDYEKPREYPSERAEHRTASWIFSVTHFVGRIGNIAKHSDQVIDDVAQTGQNQCAHTTVSTSLMQSTITANWICSVLVIYGSDVRSSRLDKVSADVALSPNGTLTDENMKDWSPVAPVTSSCFRVRDTYLRGSPRRSPWILRERYRETYRLDQFGH